jgi:thiamine pyrophosphate-dependent acetolactate synthase large subunit-like protein
MRVFEAISASLLAHQVEPLVGLMGDGNMLYISDYVERGGRFISVAHEQNGVSVARGLAFATGGVGVVSVTHGPGLTHGLTALIEGVRSGSPLVVLTGDTPPVRRHLQAIDVEGFAALAGAGYERVGDPHDTSSVVSFAFRRALAEKRPIVLDVPDDLLRLDAGDRIAPPNQVTARPGAADADALDDALGVILGADHPVILAGRGAVAAGARESLLELAELVGAPVCTTLLAKDYFHGDDFNLGVCGTVATPRAAEYLGQTDCVIAFGASINRYTTFRGEFTRGRRIVHIDSNPAALGKWTPIDVGIVGDAESVARQMTARLTEIEENRTAKRGAAMAARVAGASDGEPFKDNSTDTSIDPRTAVRFLDGILPQNRNIVTDLGRMMRVPWRYLRVPDAATFTHTVNYGSISLGLGAGIGMALGRPDNVTVVFVGDGGFMQSAPDIATAARCNLPIIVVVTNDSAYGSEWEKLRLDDADPRHSRLEWPELRAVAQAYGARAVTVRNRADLDVLPPEIDRLDGPLVIELIVDPSKSQGHYEAG